MRHEMLIKIYFNWTLFRKQYSLIKKVSGGFFVQFPKVKSVFKFQINWAYIKEFHF